MLWLVLEQRPDVEVRILTSGESRLLHGNLDEIFQWWRERFPAMRFEEVLMDRWFADEWKDATFAEQRRAGRGDIRREIPKTGEFDGWFIGLRSDESRMRRFWNNRRISGTQHSIYQYKSGGPGRVGAYRICPMAMWTTQDIGALIAMNDIPLPLAYEPHGLGHRTTMRLTSDAFLWGALAEVRARDPERYRAIVRRFPELNRST